MALDSATTAFLAAAAEAAGSDAKPMWHMEPLEARAASAGMDAMFGTGPEMHRTEDHMLTGIDGGQFEVRVHVPVAEPQGVFVYLHGGGWVISNIDSFDTLGRQLAEKSGCAVVLVNYRKAPESQYPIAVEDSWTALRWADENMEQLAGKRVPLFVGGDSAGGNLSAVVALRARDNKGPELAKQILIYPVTDADFTRGSYLEEENQTLLTTEFMEWFWNHYAPNTADRAHHEASPLRAESLEGVAPALVITAAHDVLRDEGEAYAQRLKESGVRTEQLRWPGQMHGFFSMVNVLPAAAEAMDFVVQSVRAELKKEAAK
ncbi:alpha/beta hydrolase [Paeniglutamicibacter sp. ORCA_105]|uniref:alpha/beta hydrolase n=1 Tax=Paeniglutamicibacter sp. ORCA_105 TaxID=3377336 RepID=UPI003893E04F